MFSSQRSLSTTRSKLNELKKARSVREWIWSGLIARIWKVCYLSWITLLFSPTSAILRWEPFIVYRNSSSSYIVFTPALMLSKSSLQAGLDLISRITSYRCCGGTASPNLSSAKCSTFTPLISNKLLYRTLINPFLQTSLSTNLEVYIHFLADLDIFMSGVEIR